MIESFSNARVIALTINHEQMTDEAVNQVVLDYENKYMLPTTDVLKHGCDKLVNILLKMFPALPQQKEAACQPQK